MTDEKIIKALEYCKKGDGSICRMAECPLFGAGDCFTTLAQNALSLINRQQTEIERLLQKTQQPQIGTTKELKVIKLVETEYEKAKKLEYVRNPLAYALHKVWKMADAEKGGAE